MSASASVIARPATSQTMQIVDCDIHPTLLDQRELFPYLPKRWQDFITSYGPVYHNQFTTQLYYPRMHPKGLRKDAYTDEGKLPGSDLSFMAKQHLLPNNVQYGILLPLPIEQGVKYVDFASAYCSAMNDWILHEWLEKDSRLRGSILVAVDDAQVAAAEIRKRAARKEFVQIFLPARIGGLLGERRYWPIFEAAEEVGLPIALHPNWSDVDIPLTSAGWPSHYIEEMSHYAQVYQAHITSLLVMGVMHHFPKLKFVCVEGGIGWVPALGWRLDKLWPRMKQEAPHIEELPSHYIRERVYITTQPIEEPRNPEFLRHIFDWIGWDRVMFSSDYPHWDTDDPSYILPIKVSADEREALFRRNAIELYGLE